MPRGPSEEWGGRTRVSAKIGAPVELKPGVLVPREVTWSLEGAEVSPGRSWPDILARFEMRDGVPTCTEFTVSSKPGDRGIMTGDLTVINLERIAENAFLSQATVELPAGGHSLTPQHAMTEVDAAIRRAGARRWSSPEEELKSVARVWLNPAHRGAERKAVAAHLGVSDETASRRVREARRRGYIPPRGASEAARAAALAALETLQEEDPAMTLEEFDEWYAAHKRRMTPSSNEEPVDG